MPMAARWRWRWIAAKSICFQPNSPVRFAITRCRNWSRACSRLTARWARVPSAMAWVTSVFSIPNGLLPFHNYPSVRAQLKAGTGATSSTSRCWTASPSFMILIWNAHLTACRIISSRLFYSAAARSKSPSTISTSAANPLCASTASKA